MKDLFYEYRPYIYFIIASLAVVFNNGTKATRAFSFLLLACSLIIIYWRHHYRAQQKMLKQKAAREKSKRKSTGADYYKMYEIK